MSTKSHYWNPAQMSQTSNLVLMNPALKKVIWGWTMYGGDNTLEGLGDNGGVQSEVKENSFRLVWKNDAGSYQAHRPELA